MQIIAAAPRVTATSCLPAFHTFHAHIEEKSVAPVEALRRRLVHVHLSENDRGTVGTGQVQWDATFNALKKINYDRWLVVEAFGRALPDLIRDLGLADALIPLRDLSAAGCVDGHEYRIALMPGPAALRTPGLTWTDRARLAAFAWRPVSKASKPKR